MQGNRIYLSLVILMVFFTQAVAASEKEVWIDVRSVAEYQADHIDGHLNIPHTQIKRDIGNYVTALDTPILLYCRSGQRADTAMSVLKAMGYHNVKNLGGLEDARQVIKAKTN